MYESRLDSHIPISHKLTLVSLDPTDAHYIPISHLPQYLLCLAAPGSAQAVKEYKT